ncbi:hypothetical protein ABZ848_14515 [Streptomyces sp. NPDC047081]|uniref:hypothetical protein n=1 Tax=Streptomyces sp. NPDC047081 TaxID=3154706 RepID=UPI0033F1A3DA
MTGGTGFAVADSVRGLLEVLEWGERDGSGCEVAVVLPRHARTREQLWCTARLARSEGVPVGLYGSTLALAPRLARAGRVVLGASCSRALRLLVAAGARDVVEARGPGHGWLRRRFGLPDVLSGTDLVGAPGVPVDEVATLAHRLNAERYFAHPRESDQRLRRLAARGGLDVVRPEAALETELLRGPVASRLVTLRPAPALASLLAGCGVDVVDAAASPDGLLRLLRG